MTGTHIARLTATLALTACLLTACGDDTDETSGKLVTSDNGATKRAKLDPKTGLRFEVYSSPEKYGGGSTITVKATDKTSDATIAKLTEHNKVAVSCHVPGTRTSYFPQPWKRAERYVASALLVGDDRSAARDADRCDLTLGEPGPDPDTISFSYDPDDAFASVSFSP